MTHLHSSRLKPLLLLPLALLLGLVSLASARQSTVSSSTVSSSVVSSAADLPIYTDSLASGWANWSWDSTINLAAASPVHAGSASISGQFNAEWAGFYLHAASVDTTGYDTLRFWIHGGSTGGQKVAVGLNFNGTTVALAPQANTWSQVSIPLSDLGSPATINDLVWQDTSGGGQPVFYLDDIALVNTGLPTPTPVPTGVGPALSVDAAADRHAIRPYIYGMNFASEAIASDLDLPVRRWGGNSTSRYNWQNNATNTGSDWYYENVPEASADSFVDQDLRTGTQTLLTVPLIGWVAKSRPSAHPYDCGFKISKYGAQQDNDADWDPDCGNGILTNGTPITGNDPLDTSLAITPVFVTGWIDHLTEIYGSATSGGVMFYDLDNEPMLWNSTHRDVHPDPTTYDELRNQTWAYAAALKAADPTAQTLGPVLWGWCAYFYSALDECSPGTDYSSHGSLHFVPWYLQQMQAYEQAHAVRILDYLDLHYYPQATGVSLSTAGNAATQALRLRSTRSLWDPTYADESWIADVQDGPYVRLIPRMRQWVDANYPGTKLAITEYNWGGLESINGALAQADVLGIFGREGLDLATLWGPPEITQPGMYAFRMYRNYDGLGNAFGETSLQAASTDQDSLAVYAADRASDGALTLMVINKTAQTLTSSLSLSNFSPAASARVFRYSSADLNTIIQAADQPVTAAGFTASFPANSITLFILPPYTQTGTATSTPTRTSTLSPTRTFTPTSTPTATLTSTSTRTPTPSNTPTKTLTSTSTLTPTITNTPTNTQTGTLSRTPTPSNTSTRTLTLSSTRTLTPSTTPSRTLTRTPTRTSPPIGKHWRLLLPLVTRH
jgi:hypothetical protein